MWAVSVTVETRPCALVPMKSVTWVGLTPAHSSVRTLVKCASRKSSSARSGAVRRQSACRADTDVDPLALRASVEIQCHRAPQSAPYDVVAVVRYSMYLSRSWRRARSAERCPVTGRAVRQLVESLDCCFDGLSACGESSSRLRAAPGDRRWRDQGTDHGGNIKPWPTRSPESPKK